MTGLCTAPCPGNSAQTVSLTPAVKIAREAARLTSSDLIQCGTAYSYNVYGAGPGTTASSPAKPANVVRSIEDSLDVEKRSGWKVMLGSGQGKMIRRSD